MRTNGAVSCCWRLANAGCAGRSPFCLRAFVRETGVCLDAGFFVEKGTIFMNNKKYLQRRAAVRELHDAFDLNKLERAFSENWPRLQGYAMDLFYDVGHPAVVDLLQAYDHAGMNKEEIQDALWYAARVRYDAMIREERAVYKAALAAEAGRDAD